jgi:hypothetical protein
MSTLHSIDNRILLAHKYKWRGGVNACYEIQDEAGNVLFSLWSQFHAIMVLTICKRIQKLASQNPTIER